MTSPNRLGATIGAGIDALTTRRGKPLYASPRQTRGVMILPLIEKTDKRRWFPSVSICAAG
jgi:hypothetical protein